MTRRSLTAALLVSLSTSACGGPPAATTATPALPVATTEAPTAAERIANSYNGPRIRVAVGAFDELDAAKKLFESMGWKGVAPLVTEQITTGLVQTGRVAVLERAQIGKIVGNAQVEKEGDMSKYFDQKSTAETGKLQGAQAMLVGSVIRFEPNVDKTGGGLSIPMLGGLKYHEDKAVVGINVRLVDQETGKVLCAAEGEGTIITRDFGGSVTYQNVTVGAGSWSRTPLGEATRAAGEDALKKLLAGVKGMPWEGAVADVKGPDKVFISAGEDLNLKPGDKFRVIHKGEPIKGPDGAVLGYDESEAGWVELTSVQPKMSIAKVTEGTPPVAGDKVRLPPTGP